MVPFPAREATGVQQVVLIPGSKGLQNEQEIYQTRLQYKIIKTEGKKIPKHTIRAHEVAVSFFSGT